MPAISLKLFIVLLSAPIYPTFFILKDSKIFSIPHDKKQSAVIFPKNTANGLNIQKISSIEINDIFFQTLNVEETIIEIEKSIFEPLLKDLSNIQNINIDNIFDVDSLAKTHYQKTIQVLLTELKSSLIQKKTTTTALFDKHKEKLISLQAKASNTHKSFEINEDEKKALLSFLILFEDLCEIEKEYREKFNVINSKKQTNETPKKIQPEETVKRFVNNDLENKSSTANWDPDLLAKFWTEPTSPNFSIKNEFVDKDLIKIYQTSLTVPTQTKTVSEIEAKIATITNNIKEVKTKITDLKASIVEVQKINISDSTKTKIDEVNEYENTFKTKIKDLKTQQAELQAKKTAAKKTLDSSINNLPKSTSSIANPLKKIKDKLNAITAQHDSLETQITKINQDIVSQETLHANLKSKTQKLKTFMEGINSLLSSYKTTSPIATEIMQNLKKVSDNCESVENSHFSGTENTESFESEITQEGPKIQALKNLKQNMDSFWTQITTSFGMKELKPTFSSASALNDNSQNYQTMKKNHLSKSPDSFTGSAASKPTSWTLSKADHEWIGKNCLYKNNKTNLLKLTAQKTKFDEIHQIIQNNSKFEELNSIKNQLKPKMNNFHFYWTQVKKVKGKYVSVEPYKKVS